MSWMKRVIGASILIILAGAVVLLAIGIPLRASPGQQVGVDLERLAALKDRVEELRRQGYDVSRLDLTIADVEQWIAQGKTFEASLRLSDLEADLSDPRMWGKPPAPVPADLPPAPSFPPLPESGSTVLFQEDFPSPNALASWQSAFLSPDPGNMAHWEVRQGALYLNLEAGGMQIVGMVNVAGETWADYVYEADLYATGNLEMGLVFRYRDGDFYRFRFLSWEHVGVPTRLLERVIGGQTTLLAASEGPGYRFGQWYHVGIVTNGPRITVYLDGQPILEAEDGHLSQGKVGVFALSLGDVYVDNIRVTTVR